MYEISKLISFLYADIFVGFERNYTAVNEGIGSFQLCVRIFTEASLLPIHINFSFFLSLESLPGSAGTDAEQFIMLLLLIVIATLFPFQIPVTIFKSTRQTIPSCPSPLTLLHTDSVSMLPLSAIVFSKTQRNFPSACH